MKTKTPSSRMPRMVQAASTPGIVSRKVPLNCFSIAGGSAEAVEDLLLAGVEEENAEQEVDAGEEEPVDSGVLPLHLRCGAEWSVAAHSPAFRALSRGFGFSTVNPHQSGVHPRRGTLDA